MDPPLLAPEVPRVAVSGLRSPGFISGSRGFMGLGFFRFRGLGFRGFAGLGFRAILGV